MIQSKLRTSTARTISSSSCSAEKFPKCYLCSLLFFLHQQALCFSATSKRYIFFYDPWLSSDSKKIFLQRSISFQSIAANILATLTVNCLHKSMILYLHKLEFQLTLSQSTNLKNLIRLWVITTLFRLQLLQLQICNILVHLNFIPNTATLITCTSKLYILHH